MSNSEAFWFIKWQERQLNLFGVFFFFFPRRYRHCPNISLFPFLSVSGSGGKMAPRPAQHITRLHDLTIYHPLQRERSAEGAQMLTSLGVWWWPAEPETQTQTRAGVSTVSSIFFPSCYCPRSLRNLSKRMKSVAKPLDRKRNTSRLS